MTSGPLSSWLGESVAAQLYVAHAWFLQEQERQREGIKLEPDDSWVGLYEDNGSCINIRNEILPEQQGTVQIIGISPLIISDGETSIQATLTAKCESGLRKNHNGKRITADALHHFISIRRYDIRHTSYGPPRDRLRLVLRAIEWQANQNEASEVLGSPTPVHASKEFTTLLQRFKDTRSEADHRRLRSDEPNGADTMSESMDISDEDNGFDASLDTQMPFATQAAYPFGGRPLGEPPAHGTHAMEPVLAGTSRREELRPAPKGAHELLNLLNWNQAGRTANMTTTVPRQEGLAQPPAARIPDKPASLGAHVGQNARPPAALQQPSGRNRSVDTLPTNDTAPLLHAPMSQVMMDSVAGTQEATRHAPDRPTASEPIAQVTEADWLTGYTVNHQTTKVTKEQKHLLSKSEAWQKPPVGYRFPDANIPIKIFTELSRPNNGSAAVESDTEDEAESAADQLEDDPLPGSDIEKDQDRDQDLPTSPIPWSPSPSPQPPKLQTRLDLPPDSSIGNESNSLTPNFPSVRQPGTITAQLSQQPIDLDSSNDENMADTPSSPPLAREQEESDEDMEMEVSVPQGLGDDDIEVSVPENTGGISVPGLNRSISVVQVKETPYAKGKNGQTAPPTTLPSSLPNQSSSTEMKDTSSTSVISGTYNEAQPTATNGRITTKAADSRLIDSTPQIPSQDQESAIKQPTRKRVRFPSIEADDITMLDTSSNPTPILRPFSYRPEVSLNLTPLRSDIDDDMHPVQLEPSPMSAQIPPEDPKSSDEHSVVHANGIGELHNQLTPVVRPEASVPSVAPRKRKPDTSPSSRRKQPTKRREIKVVGFGGPPRVPQNPTEYPPGHTKQSPGHVRESFKPDARTSSFASAIRDRSTYVDTSSDDEAVAKPAHATNVQKPDVEMENKPVQIRQHAVESTLVPPMSPSATKLTGLAFVDAQKSDEARLRGTGLLTSSPVVADSVHNQQNITSTHLENPSRTDAAREPSVPIASQSELDTLMLDQYAISSTCPEDLTVKDFTIKRSETIVENPDTTVEAVQSEASVEKPGTTVEDIDNPSSPTEVLNQPIPGITQPRSTTPELGATDMSPNLQESPNGEYIQDVQGVIPPEEDHVHHDPSPAPEASKKRRAAEMDDADASEKPKTSLGRLDDRSFSSRVESRSDSRLSSVSDVPSLGVKSGAMAETESHHLAAVQDQGVLTVFRTFKNAYPEYSGDVKHFTGLCKQMLKLDQDDKMVPRKDWDDYMIRDKTDYREYIIQCLDEGEVPEPYFRFYKDNVEGTLYKKRILKNRTTLATAVEELQSCPTPPRPAVVQSPPRSAPPSPQPERAYLPARSNRESPQVEPAFSPPERPSPRPDQVTQPEQDRTSRKDRASQLSRATQPSRAPLPSSFVPVQLPARAKTRKSLPWEPSQSSSTPDARSKNVPSVFAPRATPPVSKARAPINPPPLRRQSSGTSQASRTGPSTSTPRERAQPPSLLRQSTGTSQVSRTFSTSSTPRVASHNAFATSTPRDSTARKSSGNSEIANAAYGMARMKSATGESRVDPANPGWPGCLAVRTVVGRERKLDVLAWGDVL